MKHRRFERTELYVDFSGRSLPECRLMPGGLPTSVHVSNRNFSCKPR